MTQSNGSIDTSKNNGQIGRIDGFIGGSGTKEWDQRLVYDELGRLKTAAEYQQGNNSSLTWSQQYTFDRWGNRFQSGSGNSGVASEPVVTSDIDAATNRFIASGTKPTTYDAAGNVTIDTRFRSLKYEYDANGRQTTVKLTNDTNVQSAVYDCSGQRVQTTANSVTRTMVYDIFGQQVADYSGGALQRENIYRGGQLLSVIETPTATPPTSLSAAPTGTVSAPTITLSWLGSASSYRVERKGAGTSYERITTTSSSSYIDTVSSGAYLYKVCAADAQNNCTSNYTNIALGATVTFPTDPTITGIVDDPTGVNVTTVKAAHISELRSAVNAVRSLAGWGAASWTNAAAAGDPIYKEDVRGLREKLDEALVALGIQISNYTDSPLVGAPNGTLIKKTHITELRDRTRSGSGTSGSGGSSGGVQYVLSDVQGSSRAVMNNNGAGTSTVVARHDYLPFGQELGSLTGLRTGTQGYGASDTNRQKYGLTERDDATGLDHTWWRKYENTAGRWTSPDPLAGSITDPQSFNRYAYTQNDPVNFIDPTGLGAEGGGGGMCYLVATGTYWDYKDGTRITKINHTEWRCIGGRGGGGFVGGSGGGGPQTPVPITVRYMNQKYVKPFQKALTEAEKRLQKNDCAKLFGKSTTDLVNMLENTE